MQIDVNTGQLKEARQQVSLNCDDRPDETDIALIVIHGISLPPGEFANGYIDQFFCNQLNPNDHPYFKEIAKLNVSSHLLVKRDGEIVQYVPFQQRAWHAGISSYKGRDNCNDFSIGIEMEGADEIPYTDVQYQILSTVLLSLFKIYSRLNQHTIVAHSEISPGRKTDPGIAFDWIRLNTLLSA